MLSESIDYLKDSEHAWKTSIIGGLLLLFGFLVIPFFLVWGYVVRVLERTARGEEEPPVFEEWGELTVEGTKAFVVLLAYSLVPLVVGAVTLGGAALLGAVWVGAGGTTEPTSALEVLLGVFVAFAVLFGSLLTFLAAVAAAYTAPAGLAHFAEERRIGAAFDFEELRPVLATSTYTVAWLLALGIVVVGTFVGGVLNAIPFVGTVLGAIVAFYALVAAYYVIGRTWGDLHPVSLDEPDEGLPDERPVV